MKKLLLLLLVPFIALANPIDQQCPQFVSHGAPISTLSNTQYLCRKNYAVNYRNDTKTAEFVVEHVTKESVSGNSNRQDNFRADTDIPLKYRSLLSDYVKAGYDRGHLSPAGDNTTNDVIMSESFLLSNMVPQNSGNNRGIWNQLEQNVRIWVEEGKDIYVVSGTLYMPNYKTIGKGVGVPTYLWKVVYDNHTNSTISFVIPNEDVNAKNLPIYVTSLTEVERLTNLKIMPKLDDVMKRVPVNTRLWSSL